MRETFSAPRRARYLVGRFLLVATLVAGLAVVEVARPSPAQAVQAERLLNRDFTTTTATKEADEWMENNLGAAFECPYDNPPQGCVDQTPSHYVTNEQPGSIWTDVRTGDTAGDKSAALYPHYSNSDWAAHPPVLTQEIPTKYFVDELGPSVDVTGYWLRTAGSTLGVKVYLQYATTDTTGPGGEEVGVLNTADCDYSDSAITNNTWESFSFSCDPAAADDRLPDAKIWEVALVIEPTGAGGSGQYIRVDELSVQTEPGDSPTGGTLESPGDYLDPIPANADLIGVSKRYHSADPQNVDSGWVQEVYSMQLDGSPATRITKAVTGYGPFGHGPVVVNPANRNLVAVTRFTEDWDDNNSHMIMIDPARVYVYDIAADTAKPITPMWWSAGLGGVAWTTDGKYIVFGVNPGGRWELWKADATPGAGYALSRVTTDENGCYESDVNVANFSHWAVYRKGTESNGNCYGTETKGELVRIHLDAPSTTQSTVCCSTTPNGIARDGLNYGPYDPDFAADDQALIFSNSVTDSDQDSGTYDPDDQCSDANALDAYETETIAVTGGTRGCLFAFDSIDGTDAPESVERSDWTYSITPGIAWNPSVPANQQGIAYDIVHESDNTYSYWGLSTYNPAAVSSNAYTHGESQTGDNGLAYAKWIAGGHHDPASETAPGGAGTGFDSATYPATNAFTNNNTYAGAIDAADDGTGTEYHAFYTFGTENSVPSGATINGIRVQVENAYTDSLTSTPSLAVRLSWDQGVNWSSFQTVTDGTSTEWSPTHRDFYAGAYNDTWGHNWTSPATDWSKLRIQVRFDCTGTGCPSRDWYVDHLGVRVFWRPAAA